MKTVTNYYKHARPEVAVFVPSTIKTILDVGCGKGEFLKLVKQKTGAETWGIEPVEIDIEEKSSLDKLLTGKVEDIISSIPDSYFDCITLNDVLEHLQEPTILLKLIKTKLKKDGIIISSIPNVRFIGNIKELLIKKDWEYKEEGILDSTHLRFFTQRSMIRMFEDAGYKIVKQEGINELISWKFRVFNFLTFNIFSDMKYYQFVCIASIK